MPTREQMHNQKSVLLTATATSTGTITSAALDVSGYEAATINFHYGATAPTPTSYGLTECATSGGSYTAVAAADIIDDGGTHAVSTTRRVAYVGKLPFIKGVVVQSASTILTITATLGLPDQAPVTNPI